MFMIVALVHYFFVMQKRCPKCVNGRCKKNGIRNRKQRYRCTTCGHVFWWTV